MLLTCLILGLLAFLFALGFYFRENPQELEEKSGSRGSVKHGENVNSIELEENESRITATYSVENSDINSSVSLLPPPRGQKRYPSKSDSIRDESIPSIRLNKPAQQPIDIEESGAIEGRETHRNFSTQSSSSLASIRSFESDFKSSSAVSGDFDQLTKKKIRARSDGGFFVQKAESEIQQQDENIIEFLGKGRRISLFGHDIVDPFIYVQASESTNFPFVITTGKRPNFSQLAPEPLDSPKPYYEMNDLQKATFIRWLDEGKKSSSVDLAYIYVYFYGLENRFFTDSQDRNDILQETIRLCTCYPNLRHGFSLIVQALLGLRTIDQGTKVAARKFLKQFPCRFRNQRYYPTLVKKTSFTKRPLSGFDPICAFGRQIYSSLTDDESDVLRFSIGLLLRSQPVDQLIKNRPQAFRYRMANGKGVSDAVYFNEIRPSGRLKKLIVRMRKYFIGNERLSFFRFQESLKKPSTWEILVNIPDHLFQMFFSNVRPPEAFSPGLTTLDRLVGLFHLPQAVSYSENQVKFLRLLCRKFFHDFLSGSVEMEETMRANQKIVIFRTGGKVRRGLSKRYELAVFLLNFQDFWNGERNQKADSVLVDLLKLSEYEAIYLKNQQVLYKAGVKNSSIRMANDSIAIFVKIIIILAVKCGCKQESIANLLQLAQALSLDSESFYQILGNLKIEIVDGHLFCRKSGKLMRLAKKEWLKVNTSA